MKSRLKEVRTRKMTPPRKRILQDTRTATPDPQSRPAKSQRANEKGPNGMTKGSGPGTTVAVTLGPVVENVADETMF